MKRRSRREAVATLFAADLTTFEPYQPGRTRVPVYTEGRDYYVALRDGERAPEGFGEWQSGGEALGYRILIAKAEATTVQPDTDGYPGTTSIEEDDPRYSAEQADATDQQQQQETTTVSNETTTTTTNELRLRAGRELTERGDYGVKRQLRTMQNSPAVYWSTPHANSYVAVRERDGRFSVLSINGIGEVRWEIDPLNTRWQGDSSAQAAVEYFFESNPLSVAERRVVELARRYRSPQEWAALPVRDCACGQRFKVEHAAQTICRDCMRDDGVGFSFYPSEVQR